jgi:hypothetical protein
LFRLQADSKKLDQLKTNKKAPQKNLRGFSW